MTRSLVAALCALCSASACNVATVQEQPSAIPQNRCTSDADCALGSCDGQICRTTKGSFDTILFEITPLFASTPPADVTSIAGVQFIEAVDHVLDKNDTLNLQLDFLAKISGEVTLAEDMCTPQFVGESGLLATSSDRSIPALVTLTPSSSALGLFSSPVAATADLADMSHFVFNLKVPVGQYDIYIQPQPQPTGDCPVPPQLLRGYSISGKVNLNIGLQLPQTFDFHVIWPLGDGALDGWSVDMLDPISGHVISKRVALERSSKASEYVAKLAYLPVLGDTVRVDQFVRLSPPDGVPAPTLLFARSGLGLFSVSGGTLTQFKSLPTPVHLVGAVTEGVTPKPLAASVTLVATKINGVDPGVVASFVRKVDVQQDGSFALDVLPGTYRVAAAPAGVTGPTPTSLAQAKTEWVIGDTPSVQAGKVIDLSDTLPINGVALDPSGTTAMVGAQVQAVPSPASVATDALRQALGETVFVPRAFGATVEGGGSFSVSVDTGNYDFSVRPRSSSGYAWLVIPSLPVVANNGGAGLNTVTLPLPVSYHGNLTVSGAADSVPGAVISAYIYMKDGQYTADSTQADSVLQIAETRSDDTGAFDLRIPAALNALATP